jgi:hypothetical protein
MGATSMTTSAVARATVDLKEAIREIHITAGLDEPAPSAGTPW